jgi:hypothetical protein
VRHKEFLSRNQVAYTIYASRSRFRGTKSIKLHFLQKLYGLSEDGPMNPPDEFQKHAADCMHMAKLSRDAESKAMWNRMAERWRQCAERYVGQSIAARDQLQNRRRKSPPGWAHY